MCTATLLRRADLRHPLAQRRDRDLAPDDDQRHQHVSAVQVHQHQQRGADQELVGHRVEKGAERRGLVQLARQIAVEPVGDREQHEHARWRSGCCVGAVQRQVEHTDDQRDRDDARPGQQGRDGRRTSGDCAARRPPHGCGQVQRARLEAAVVVEQEDLDPTSTAGAGATRRRRAPRDGPRRWPAAPCRVACDGTRNTRTLPHAAVALSSISSTGMASSGSGTGPS